MLCLLLPVFSWLGKFSFKFDYCYHVFKSDWYYGNRSKWCQSLCTKQNLEVIVYDLMLEVCKINNYEVDFDYGDSNADKKDQKSKKWV